MKSTKIYSIIVLIAFAMQFNASAHEAGTWLVRSRAIYIAPSVSTTTLDIDVKTQATPEFDFSYFVAKNISLELILGMARHQINLNGAYLGTIMYCHPH